MNHELIQQIEQAVKKVLQEQSLIASSTASGKQLLAIFDAAIVDLEEPLRQLEQCLQAGYAIKVILSDLSAKVLNLNQIKAVCGDQNVLVSSEITDLNPFLDEYPLLILPVFSYSMAAQLSLGLTDTPCTFLVFQALLRGDKVVATPEFLENPSRLEKNRDQLKNHDLLKNRGLSKLGKEYLRKLSEFGMQFVRINQIAEVVLASNETSNFGPPRIGHEKTVVSASVIANLAPTVKTYVYANPAIITPLARDLATQRGIQLIPQGS